MAVFMFVALALSFRLGLQLRSKRIEILDRLRFFRTIHKEVNDRWDATQTWWDETVYSIKRQIARENLLF